MKSIVTIRDLQKTDVPLILDYWFRSPSGFIESLGVDLGKMPEESAMKASLMSKIDENLMRLESKLNIATILRDGRPVGVHTLAPYTEGDSGIFHAHIWNAANRGMGVGLRSYPLACRLFIERFRLNKILFKTPIHNSAAIRVKQKLGIRTIGQERIGFGIVRENTLAQVFELTAEDANQLRVIE